VKGEVGVRCFPYPRIVAEEAVRLATGKRVVWDQTAGFCYGGK